MRTISLASAALLLFVMVVLTLQVSLSQGDGVSHRYHQRKLLFLHQPFNFGKAATGAANSFGNSLAGAGQSFTDSLSGLFG